MAKDMCFVFAAIILFSQVFNVIGKQAVIELNEATWDAMLSGEWMVEFYAPWCPACKALDPVWKDFATWSEDLNIHIAQVDVTTSPGLSGRFMVTALPTMFHVLDGEFRQYRGARDKDAFISFVEEKKWQSIDATPSWKSPNSFQMSVISYFFKLSQVLRSIHLNLMEEYGLPTWGSYLIFALATIITGAVLGLLMVCVLDCIYPPQAALPRSASGLGLVKNKDEAGGGGDKASGEELDSEDEYELKEDLIDENLSDGGVTQSGSDNDGGGDEPDASPSVRKRKSRKAD